MAIQIKEGFKGQKLASLPPNVVTEFADDPLISGLYVRKIGFFPRVKYHTVVKPMGVNYCMLVFCTEGRGSPFHPMNRILSEPTPRIHGAYTGFIFRDVLPPVSFWTPKDPFISRLNRTPA